MRILHLAIAILLIAGCSSAPTVKEQPSTSAPAITTLENPAVVYDRATVTEVELNKDSPNLPKMVAKADPYFPEIALRAGLEGNVQTQILIAPSGEVKAAKILKSDAQIFNQPSLEAALRWKFEPPIVDGKPAAVWVTLPFRFAISKK